MGNNYKKGIAIMFLCYLIWGFQPLYWNLCEGLDVFFLLAMRIVFASLFCVLLILAQGKKEVFLGIFKNKELLIREIFASVLLFFDWAIYLWAVKDGRVMECALGYYIQPIVVFIFGTIIFKERISIANWMALLIVAIGVAISAKGFGEIPWVTVALALLFAFYVAIKKSIMLDSIVTTGAEIIMMIPFSITILLLSVKNGSNIQHVSYAQYLLLIGSGIVTSAPMLLYAIGIKCLPLTAVAICQYLSPTISIFCGMIMGEELNKEKMLSFSLVWVGIVLYVITGIIEGKKEKERNIT